MTDLTDLIARLRKLSEDSVGNYGMPVAGEAADALEEQGRRLAEVVSVNTHLAALVTDAQEELRKCQQDAIQLQARLAEAVALLTDARDSMDDEAQHVGLVVRIDAFLARENERG